jgi:hypothetical protein
MKHTQQEVGSADTVVGFGDVVAAAADEVVVGGEFEDGVEPATGGGEGAVVAHKNEARVEANDHIQDQAGDSAFLSGSGLAAELSRPELGGSG